jgi:negative regulator of sigma E activity
MDGMRQAVARQVGQVKSFKAAARKRRQSRESEHKLSIPAVLSTTKATVSKAKPAYGTFPTMDI